MRKILKVLLTILLIIIVFVAGVLLILTITDYKPESIEKLKVTSKSELKASGDETFSIVSWNIGYAALGDNIDPTESLGDSIYGADADTFYASISADVSMVTLGAL